MLKINKKEIQDKTLANLPYQINNIQIKPKSLRDINSFGEEQFYYHLQLLIIDKNDLLPNIQSKDKEGYDFIQQMSNFDLLVLQSVQSEAFFKILQKALLYFLGEKEDNKIGFLFNGKIQDIKKATFYIGDLKNQKLINNDNFEDIKSTLLIQNAIEEKSEKEKLNPVDNKAKNLIARREKMRSIVQKSKAKNGLQLRDLISIVASNNDIGLNIITIYDINMYMLQNQLQRIAINENYAMQKFLLGNSFGGSSVDFKNNTYLKKL